MDQDKPKKYITSNNEILNKHFEQALLRENEIVRSRKASTFWKNAKSISLILFFLGIAAMFIGKAFFLAKEEKIVERVVEIQSSNTDSSNTSEITVDGETIQIKKDVIHFVEAKVTYKGISYTVFTRHNYKDPRDERPFMQSCYLGYSGFMVELSKKIGTSAIKSVPANSQLDMIEAINLRTSDISYFPKYCRYI